ncbi:hypothetical protein G5C65_30425 [Streptomyces sp. SB3404]|uniref:Uncharacterized protein n=2 Tax=Streptomyces boncukensis TaxID=2711219 RepID=A0A6G4X5C7_9ACTN|nr:hypothetical protein [Streptomyces boncukensis]NGO72598.1 hypothetical protein [Streptomyces boncukensis]
MHCARSLSDERYLLCIPWDLRNRPESPGAIDETTPVSLGGVLVLAVVLVALAAYFGLRDRLVWAVPVVAAPPVLLMYASFMTHASADASPWPVAAAFFMLVISGATLLAAYAAQELGRRVLRS